MKLHQFPHLVRIHASPTHLGCIEPFGILEQQILRHGRGCAKRTAQVDKMVAFSGSDGRGNVMQRSLCSWTGRPRLASQKNFFKRVKLLTICIR